MRKLIIIGNGFDLAHGLETRYSDFILSYLNKSFLQSTREKKFNDNIIEISSGDYYKNPIKLKSLDRYKDFCNDNGIIVNYPTTFIENIIKNATNRWVDIEYEYYFSLLSLFKRLEIKNLDRHEIIRKELGVLNSCFEQLKNELVEYLQPIENKKKEYDPKIFEILENIVNDEKVVNQKVCILNFNYTSTISLYNDVFNLQHTKPTTINIHGDLNNMETNPIIFGYGDEMDVYYQKIERLNNNDFLKNFKSFGYFKTKQYQDFSLFLDQPTAFKVYILGHSCGISDRILLNSIFEHKFCHKIKIYHYKKSETENDYFEKTQEISRHFSAKSKNSMRNKILTFDKDSFLAGSKN